MALIIERVLDTRFQFQYNGGNILSSDTNRLFTDGNYCHFKTGTGANIIKQQNVTFADVTIIDTFGGTGTFSSFPNVQSLWNKLIELNFFAGLGGFSGSGSSTYQGLTDTDPYYGNDGKIPIVNESELKLDYTTFYNFDKFTQLSDVEIASLINGKIIGVTLVSGVPKITLVDKPSDGTTYFSAVGGFDYNDLATQTTPLAYTSGNLQLTNDILGNKTFLSKPPYGITILWNEDTNTVDFSQLSIGDRVDLFISLLTTTSASNQTSNIKILLGEGTADEETLTIETFYTETIAETSMQGEIGIVIKNNNHKNTPAKILFSSDTTASVKIDLFKFYIIRKSINILDVQVKGSSEKPPYELATASQTDIEIDASADNVDIWIGSVYQIENIHWNRFSPGIARMVTPLDEGDVITKRTYTSESIKEPFLITTDGQASITLSNNPRSVDVLNGSVMLIEGLHYSKSENLINFTLPYTVDAGDYITVRKFR